MDNYVNYDLTDEQWKRIQPLLPPEHTGKKGRPRKDDRIMLNGMLWMNHSGAQWRQIPKRYGPWQSVYARFAKWRVVVPFAKIIGYPLVSISVSITKKGYDMIANKMTGKKGVLFTAAYVTAFEEMRQAIVPVPRHIPDVSPAGLAKLINVTRQVMLDMVNSPVEIGAMTKSVLETWGILVPLAFSKQIPGQLSLFEPLALQ